MDKVGALVVLSVSKPNGHDSRGKSTQLGLFWLAEWHAVNRLTERSKCTEIMFSKYVMIVWKCLSLSNQLEHLHMDATFL